MSLRLKILLIFCLLALLPAMVTAVLDTQRLQKLSLDLTTRHAAVSAEQSLATMQRIAIDYAERLDRETRRVRTLLELQADTAARLLRQSTAASTPVFFSEAFDEADPHLDLTERPAGGPFSSGEKIPVSWSEQVFYHPADIKRDELLPSAERLGPMLELYTSVRDEQDRFIRSQYVDLENGLSAAYPGHGHYPADFDPRQRPWYVEQKHHPRFRWYRPHIDAASGALVMNGTMPLFDAAGEFIGITGIDVDLNASFAALQLPAYLREGSELIQVVALAPPQVDTAQILVLARSRADRRSDQWRALPELERFELVDQATTAQLQDAMLNKRNGYLQVALEGRDSFVLYQKFGRESAYLVMVVPVATATRAAIEADQYAQEVTRDHITTLIRFLLAASTLVVIVALVSSRQLTRPIEQLMDAVQQLAAGDFNARAAVNTGDELGTLGKAFNTMVPQLEYRARLDESMALAREIQQQLLPAEAPRIAGYDIVGRSIYSEQTGGDYFDYIALNGHDSTHGIVVADVTGHGVGASLLMATTRALLHGGHGRGLEPGELLSFVNAELVDDVTRGHFVTLFILGLNQAHGGLAWATAGHDAALYLCCATGQLHELGGDDIPLGIDADWTFQTRDGTSLAAGDVVVIGTDGIWEAANSRGERFGKERLKAYVVTHAASSAAQLCAGVLAEVEQFRGSQAQHDDITLVVIKRTAEG